MNPQHGFAKASIFHAIETAWKAYVEAARAAWSRPGADGLSKADAEADRLADLEYARSAAAREDAA